jgi:hypothetical protein
MTKKLFYPVFAFVVAVSLSGLAWAQGGEAKTIKAAYLVDVACSKIVVKDASKAAAHSGKNGCAINKPGCKNSGTGVFVDGKFLTISNDKGKQLAIAALEGASKETGAKYTVVGKVTGETIEVESITEEK